MGGQFRQAPTRVLILTQLKLLQRLGYMPPMSDVPPAIIGHVCAMLGTRLLTLTTIARYDRSCSAAASPGTRRSCASTPAFARWTRRPTSGSHPWLPAPRALKTTLPDIVNVLLGERVRHRYEPTNCCQ
ncbi:hypothetical protein AABE10_35215 [Paraburkholderia diazotrophica]